MPRFITNTYSNYAPTKVGDTVQEQALLSQVQASNYLQASKEYADTDSVLENLETAPGGEWGLNQFKDFYGSEYRKAEEEGNLEDMVGNAGKLIKKGYEDYNLGRIIKDREAYQNNMKALEEADIPENYKEVSKMKMLASNPGYIIDPDTGEKKFKPYQPINVPTYVKVDEEVNKILSGWQADNTYTRDENTGEIIVNTDLLDSTGSVYLRKGQRVTRAEIADYVRSFLTNEEFIKRSLQDQADINVSEVALKSGKFDEDEFNYLVAKNNPYAQGTPQFENFQRNYITVFNDRLNSAREEAAITGLKFDEAGAKFAIAKNLQENLLTNAYIDNAMDKHGYQREELTNYKVKDLEDSKSGSKIIDSLDAATYYPVLTGTGDTQSAATINMGNLYENKKNLQNNLQFAKSSLAALEQDPNASQISIDKQRAVVERIQRDLENTNIISESNARQSFDVLSANGIKLKHFDDYDTMIKTNYRNYKTIKDTQLNKGERINTDLQEYYAKINPSYTIDKNTPLNEEEFVELFEYYINSGEALPHTVRNEMTSISEFRNKLNDFTKKNPDAIDMFRNDQVFKLAFADTTAKDRGPYRKYIQTMEAISDIVSSDLGAFKTFDGTPLSQLVDGEKVVQDGKMEVILQNSAINGRLAANVIIPVRVDGKAAPPIMTKISLDTDNSNSQTIEDLVHDTFSDLSTVLSTNYDKLDANKRNMLNAVNSIVNVTDGTARRFDAMPLETAKEGEVFPKDKEFFDIADSEFQFITYREGKGNTRNKFLILENNVEALTVKPNGTDPYNSTVNSGTAYGKGVLGYHINDLDKETLLPKRGVQPKYFLVEDNENTDPVVVKGKDVVPAPWFHPYDAGSAAKVREKITLDVATRRGTFDKFAPSSETMVKNPDTYIRNYTNPVTIKNKLDKQATLYTPDNGYTRLDEIALPNEISTRSNLNFVALNNEGVNRATKMFADLRTKGLKPIITGAGRDANNVVEGSAEHSKHKKFGSLDLLKNEAGMYLVHLSKTNPKALEEYGISNVIAHYDGHIHIEFKDNLLNPFTEITQEQYKSLGL